ncbi:Mu-like prophage major head subunit gpT family protein [Brucella sp. HL-2]|nr:Mu-like prophage major head subunit gpT family protein [Brucella sp. HL-2]MCV9907169.1 Mu-like prophage major head subunit gpT family protein [Brucella sp. HL-2]
MIAAKLTNIDKARAAWNGEIPDWIVILAEACDRESQSAIARKVGYSASAVSQVLSNTYQNGVYGVDGRCNAGYGLWQLIYKSKLPLTAENYAAARAAMTSIRKRNGEIISINPRKLLVPSSLEGAARKLLINELGANGESNEWKGTAEPVVIPLLG